MLSVLQGGGTLYFPVRDKGVYLIKGPLVQNVIARVPVLPNSQLYIPNGPGIGTRNVAKAIIFMGERVPSFELGIIAANYPNPWNKTAIIQSTITGPGTDPSTTYISARPALLGVSADSLGNFVWNTTEVHLQNLIFRTNTKSSTNTDTIGTMSAINFGNLTGCSLNNVRIDVNSEPINSLQPNVNTYGLIMPGASNSAWNPIRNCLIGGYYTGVVAEEHTLLDYVSFMACYDAIRSTPNAHNWHATRLLMNGVANGVHVTGTSYFRIDNYDAEHFLPSFLTLWFNFQSDVKSDNPNYPWGNINYHVVNTAGPVCDTCFTFSNVNPEQVAIAPMQQSPLPAITQIGNATTRGWYGSFYNPSPVGLEITAGKLSNGATYIPSIAMANKMSLVGGEMHNFAVINSYNNKLLWNQFSETYISADQIKIKEYMTTSAPANVQVLERTPYTFHLMQPLQPHSWTTSGRPATGLSTSMIGYNSDTAAAEILVGATWYPFATRDWVRSLGFLTGNTLYTGDDTLSSDRTVTGGSNGLTFTSTRTTTNSTVSINNTSTGRGLNISTGSGLGIVSVATTGIGILGQSTDGYGIWAESSTSNGLYVQSPASTGAAEFVSYPSSSNTNNTILDLNRINSGGGGAAGIAGSIDISLNNSTGSGSMTKSLQLISKLTTATSGSEVSDLEFWGQNSGTLAKKFTIKGSGQLNANNYGSGTFTGTPATTLVATSSGDIVEEVRPKTYTALISQSGTSAPTATVLGTNTIGSISWSRSSAGVYVGTLSGAFTANKTWSTVSWSDESGGSAIVFRLKRTGSNTVELFVSPEGVAGTDNFTNLSIEIRVYP